MFKGKIKYFASGLIIGAVLFSGVGAYAASTKNLTVTILPLKYFFDGVEKKAPSGQQGFVHNGTTYVPLRFISETLNKEVSWVGKTSSIYVGKQPEGKSTYLKNMHTLTKDEKYIVYLNEFTTNMNEKFVNVIKAGNRNGMGIALHGQMENTYVLNGNYKKFEALIAPEYDWSQDKHYTLGTFKVLVDNEEVYTSGTIDSNITEPIKVSVDLTGANQFTVVFEDAAGVGLIEPKLIQ